MSEGEWGAASPMHAVVQPDVVTQLNAGRQPDTATSMQGVEQPDAVTPLRRFVVRMVPAPLPDCAVPELGRYPIYINKDRYGLAEQLAVKLRGKDVEAIITDEIPASARHVIYLGVSDEQLDADRICAFSHSAFAVARRIAAAVETEGGLFWTVQSTGGDFGLSGRSGCAGTAGLAALAKTAMKEWPKAHVKAIDVNLHNSAEDIAGQICSELFHGGLEQEIGYTAEGTRMAVGLAIAEPQIAAANVLAAGDTLLVSGGGRGVTARSIIALARRLPLRFILLGRSALADVDGDAGAGHESEQELGRLLYERASAEGRAVTPMELKRQVKSLIASREVRDTIRQLEQLGAEVIYVPVDVTDLPALSAAIRPIVEKWGAIRGIIHGAGVLADKRMVDKQDESFRQVFLTKVRGFQAMLESVNAKDLKLIAIFSSVAAREGNVGQCDYAMANEVLNKMAHRLRHDRNIGSGKCVVKSLNWGPWEGGMVTAALKRHFESQGISLIPASAGAELFAEEATRAHLDEVEIVIGGDAGSTPSFIARQERTRQLAKMLDPAQCVWLDDHRIHGYRVVPIVAVREWFARFARSAFPDLTVVRIENLRVLKGIRFGQADDAPVALTLTGKERYDAEKRLIFMDLQLEDAGGIRHYAAQAVIGHDGGEIAAGWESVSAASQAPWELESERIYGDRLFHGPSFQAIRQLLTCEAEHAAGLLEMQGDQVQTNEASTLEPFSILLDGGLQLARLWGYERHAQPSLPMSIGAAYVASSLTPEGPIRSEISVKQHNRHKFTVDIRWTDDQERCLAQFSQVEMYFVQERRTS